ncbi:hypothetical protein [Devosia lacusdianchii]|uniref:hypothetical protein n=1 Tax=Devosia lacusdianchii TaxID=2917991 RepID=UPI001F06A46A|nr:hypothetical protein [Devosia sp. JXJ CY 41]
MTWCPTLPAMADDRAVLDRAFVAALATFEQAFPKLGASAFGVDTGAYRDAMSFLQFDSAVWGGSVTVELQIRATATGSCSRFAAFVRIPPENGVATLVLCPEFFDSGTDALRELTILHEMVHVVAGSDECQAMAFAAAVEQASHGRFTSVDAYWQASGCGGSAYRLPD